ncbi:MAG: Rab family GTPase [Promethearchaeia archaeon]
MSYTGKVVMCGDSMVGKTSLLLRYSEGIFRDEYNQTVGANFIVNEINLTEILDKIEFKDFKSRKKMRQKGFKIYFWDIGGQKNTLFVTNYYFEDAHGAMVVFNLNNYETFNHLDFWVEKIHEKCGDIPYVIVGNKIDLFDGENREVPETAIEKKCTILGAPYIETSAKLNKNVDKAFNLLFQKIISNF